MYFILLFILLFIFIRWRLLYNIVVVFAIHWHESAMDLHVFYISYLKHSYMFNFIMLDLF